MTEPAEKQEAETNPLIDLDTEETVATELEKTAVETIEETVRRANGMNAQNQVMGRLMEISREIPDNVNHLSPAMAEYLAGRFLKGLELCGELYSMAINYEMKMEIQKRKEFSQAMLVRSAGVAGIKTAKEKEMFAFSDDLYLASADRYAEAKMFRVFVEEKKDSFSKAHYLVRKIVDRDQIVAGTGMEGQGADWLQTPNNDQ